MISNLEIIHYDSYLSMQLVYYGLDVGNWNGRTLIKEVNQMYFSLLCTSNRDTFGIKIYTRPKAIATSGELFKFSNP